MFVFEDLTHLLRFSEGQEPIPFTESEMEHLIADEGPRFFDVIDHDLEGRLLINRRMIWLIGPPVSCQKQQEQAASYANFPKQGQTCQTCQRVS